MNFGTGAPTTKPSLEYMLDDLRKGKKMNVSPLYKSFKFPEHPILCYSNDVCDIAPVPHIEKRFPYSKRRKRPTLYMSENSQKKILLQRKSFELSKARSMITVLTSRHRYNASVTGI